MLFILVVQVDHDLRSTKPETENGFHILEMNDAVVIRAVSVDRI